MVNRSHPVETADQPVDADRRGLVSPGYLWAAAIWCRSR